ncbi:hypothetical protein JOH51_006355 [Rhizobium leguminosarum]|nr:hypothetical protein [Rhizobium leguminosarum]
MPATKTLRPVIATAFLAVLGILLWFATRPPPLVAQGKVSAVGLEARMRRSHEARSSLAS